ncbi:MAG: hypothetical protein R3E88_13835 [Myxococcota bacterium]
MELQCLDHVHFTVPDLARAKRIYGPLLDGPRQSGHFVDDYGGPAVNAYGAWHTCGGDFIQPIDAARPAFGGSALPTLGILSPSYRVADVDRGIAQAVAHGLAVRSRVGSEDIGLGKNVVQAQLWPEPVSGLAFELVEHQLPGEYVALTDAAVEYVEFALAPGIALDAAARALEPILGDAFDAECVDAERGVRARLHRRLGLRLVAPARDADARADAWTPGLRAIAFRCADLAQSVASATAAGLAVARRSDGDGAHGARTVDFAPWAGASVRLLESAA